MLIKYPIRHFKNGAIIIADKDKGSSLCVILEGKIRIFIRDRDNNQQTLNVIGPYDFFGEMAMVKHGYRQAIVKAISDAKLIEIPFNEIRLYVKQYPNIKTNILSTYKRRLESNRSLIRREGIERRHHPRVDMHVPCKFKISDLADNKAIPGEVENISMNGALLSFKEVPVKDIVKTFEGKKVDLTFTVSDTKEIKLAATVVRVS